MPTVPRYEGPQVQERALTGTRVAQLPDGMTPGAGASRLGNMAVDIIQKAKSEADQLAVMEADRKLTEAETELLYSENGALNRRGKDAFGAPDEVNESYTKKSQEIEESLSNPIQRQKFKQIAQERGMSISRTLDKHVAGEIKSYDDNETLAYVQTQMNTAITAYQDPEKVGQAVEAQKIAIRSHAERNGMPEEWTNNKIALAESKTHASVISRYVDNGDDLEAEKYYQAVKGSITGEELAKVEKELEISSRLGFAQRKADEILAGGVSATQAYEMAKQVDDPKKRQALNEELSRQFTIKKQAERQDTEDLHMNVKNLLYQNGGNINDPKIQRALTRMGVSEDNSLRSVAKTIQEGKDIVTDQQYYRDLRELAVNSPDSFKNMNMNDPKVWGKLNPTDWDRVFKIQEAMRKGKEDPKLKNFRDDSAVAKSMMAEMKIKPSSERGAQFTNAFYPALEKFREENKRNPNDKEMQDIAKQLGVKVITDRGLIWDTKKSIFELKDDDKIVDFANPSDKEKMKTAGGSGGVIYRKTKDGRVAMYDSATKKFLGYK